MITTKIFVELFTIAPLAILAMAGLFTLIYQTFFSAKRVPVILGITIATFLVLILYYGVLYMLGYPAYIHDLIKNGPSFVFGGHLLISHHAFLYAFFTITCLLLIVVAMHSILVVLNLMMVEIYTIFLFFGLGALLFIHSNHLITTFIGIEIIALSLFIMVGWDRKTKSSNESSIKYFILSVLSIAFFLLGMAFIYGGLQTIDLNSIRLLLPKLNALGNKAEMFTWLVYTGFIFILVSFIFKIGLFPLHSWVTEVYEGTTTIFVGLMAGIVKMLMICFVVRLFYIFLPELPFKLFSIIMVVAVSSMLYGNIVALVQTNLKKIFAYSSIAHSGYMFCLISLVKFDSIMPQVLVVLMYYLIGYVISTIAIFCIIAYLEIIDGSKKIITLDSLKGLSKTHPLMAFGLSVASMSLAGLPPLVGFYGKFFLLESVLNLQLYTIAIFICLSSFIGIYYYLRVFVFCYWYSDAITPLEQSFFGRYMFVKQPIVWSVILICIMGFLSPYFYGWIAQYIML